MQRLFILVVLWTGGLCFTCLDYKSNQVDWYTVYKVPKITTSSDWKIRDGLAHFYLDVQSPRWTLSNRGMNETQQAVYETLSAVFNNKNPDTMYLMYNDQPPTGVANKGEGHTKGVLAFDKTSGFWLIHSVPRFPNKKKDGYVWPENGKRNGQSFLCVSFPYNELGNIAKQLFCNEPNVYDSSVSPSILKDFPVLNDVIKGKGPEKQPWQRVIEIKSLKGQLFKSFAKSGKFNKDLYDGLVAPTLKQNLLVQTWLSGTGGPLNSTCNTVYKVLKITDISLPKGITFTTTRDHSKWAVSHTATTTQGQVSRFGVTEYWTCVGDINRMRSQYTRGGGTLCLQNYSVWKAYHDSVKGFEKCPSVM